MFATSHAKLLELVREGLRRRAANRPPRRPREPRRVPAPTAACGVQRVWVEKILAPGERVRDWPICGTVGYEFLNDVCTLFVDPAGEAPLTELHAAITGERRSFAEVALEAQLEQARGPFARELARLVREGPFDAATLAQGLARLPVYRTYVEPDSGTVDADDRRAVEAAGMDARIARALLLEDAEPHAEFVTRFQQTSPAIAAKGIEDTAFYRYLRLIALNEVGGDPGALLDRGGRLHAANSERARRFPSALLSTQTHDTKRSADTRARIGAIAVAPSDGASSRTAGWRSARRSAARRTGGQVPDLQTLVGVWPIAQERLDAYLVKALREAKRETSWADPDERFEGSVLEFSRRLIASAEFLESFCPFAERIALAGERSALGQLLLKLTAPGFPDIYQGDELWQLSLVDPDNRRPVDWPARQRALSQLGAGAPATRATRKLAVIVAALSLRRRRAECFEGAYTPLAAGAGVCAYMRGEHVLVVIAVRPEGDEELLDPPVGRWRDVLAPGSERDLTALPLVECVVNGAGIALLERVG